MPRSAADATRFTATGPVVNSSATTIDVMLAAGPAPPNETPQQKVARLREAARRVKAGTETTSDRLLRHGRKWADGAHRVTVMGLIGLSVVCTGVAMWSLTDMMVYNRRKKKEFLREQELNYARALTRARAAEQAGTLTADLALVLNKERAVQQYEAAKAEREKRGAMRNALDWVTGGGRLEEKPGGAFGFASDEIKRIAEGRDRPDIPVVPGHRRATTAETEQQVMVKEAAAARAGVLPIASGPGSLDSMAKRASDDAVRASRGWMNWIHGR